ncbi:hypothetical protein [Caldinitratiruptor microaerophilus]|uniref:Uncharacterized protein n=1 Tax=Caldinitratiruptor microaerophilus TaxID=671077 RepID=A0AA35CNA4_9FIRM|nr:hypothetical protein [Caldinitratiruptor microaerophilus]BDG62445.1 hypothetical protein caldi_35350 [Caldinitratiruptor microaerophilus]
MFLGGQPDAAGARSALFWLLLGFSLGAGSRWPDGAGLTPPGRSGRDSAGSRGGAFSVSVADETAADRAPAPRGPSFASWPGGSGPGAVQVRVFQEVPGPDGPTYVQTTGQVVSVYTGRGGAGPAGP